jgi:hypothetical protein
MDESVVTDIISLIENRFGKMTVIRGVQHTFLGIDIVMNANGTFDMNMKVYILEAADQFKADLSATAHTRATKGLFSIKHDSPKLPGQKSDIFYTIVAKHLYISSWARTNILPTVAVLCTYISKSTE